MTLFEYLAIAFSLVLSSSAMRLIRGLSHALHRERRYWVHLCLVINQILVTLSIFWVYWSFRDVAWTFPLFVLALASPCLVYASTCALIPEDPSTVVDWREYYFESRGRFFSCVVGWALAAASISTLVLGMSPTHPARVFQAMALAGGVVGLVSGSARVHGTLAAVFLASSLLGAATVTFQAGSLTP